MSAQTRLKPQTTPANAGRTKSGGRGQGAKATENPQPAKDVEAAERQEVKLPEGVKRGMTASAHARHFVPDIAVEGSRREQSPIGVGVSVPGTHEGGVALSTAAAHRMFEFAHVAAGDPRWKKAREHKDAGNLFGTLELVQSAFLALRTGLELANAERALSSWEKEMLHDTTQIAKEVRNHLKELVPRFTELDKKVGKAAEKNDCASAWLDALPLIEKEHMSNPQLNTPRLIKAVTDARPDLAKRLRIDDAAKRGDVDGIVSCCWTGRDDAQGLGDVRRQSAEKTRRRGIAYHLAALACGLPQPADQYNNVHHACDLARARTRYPLRKTW